MFEGWVPERSQRVVSLPRAPTLRRRVGKIRSVIPSRQWLPELLVLFYQLNEPFDIHAPRLVLSVYERLPGVNVMGRIVIPNPPYHSTISPRMINSRELVVASGTRRA